MNLQLLIPATLKDQEQWTCLSLCLSSNSFTTSRLNRSGCRVSKPFCQSKLLTFKQVFCVRMKKLEMYSSRLHSCDDRSSCLYLDARRELKNCKQLLTWWLCKGLTKVVMQQNRSSFSLRKSWILWKIKEIIVDPLETSLLKNRVQQYKTPLRYLSPKTYDPLYTDSFFVCFSVALLFPSMYLQESFSTWIV